MIHKSAYVEKNVEIGKGTKIWHFVHIRKNSKIGQNCVIGKDVFIDFDITIGDNCKIQNFATLYHGLHVENDVFIGPHVCFTNDVYPRSSIWDKERVADTQVKEGASIGANSTIVAGITIGAYAMIGAGSVVTTDVPDYGLVYGNPARLKGYICKCGEPLKKYIKKKDMFEFTCSKCGGRISVALHDFQEASL